VRFQGEPSTAGNDGPLVDEVLKSQSVDFTLMFSNQSSRRVETNYEVSLFVESHIIYIGTFGSEYTVKMFILR
jgi:hypothetical protein